MYCYGYGVNMNAMNLATRPMALTPTLGKGTRSLSLPH